MLVDANLLLYAVDVASPQNAAASTWLEDALNGNRRVGLPWQTLGAFLRIITHPRITTRPLSGEQAWAHVRRWLDADPSWVPPATSRTTSLLQDVITRHGVVGNLVTDAMLAALAIEHGLTVYSADTDFARFTELRWVNPLT